jgi:lipoprotein-anchoring transpeptidase ErfK/SrfK
MKMAKNESSSLGVVILFFFSTAVLSFGLHWRISNSMKVNTPEAKNVVQATQSLQKQMENLKQSEQVRNPRRTVIARGPVRGPVHHESAFTPASGNTRVTVNLSERRVFVYHQDTVVASYPIGVGKKGWETPTGAFKVMHMQHDPAWRHPITGKIFPAGPDSPLGERWIGFWSDGKNKIGFHGTPDSDLVGSPVSHGCLRMRNPDVLLFYEQVRIGTPVEVKH